MAANVNVFGGHPQSGDSLHFWPIKHAFCKATFLTRFLWTCLHLLSSLFLLWEHWPVWETWDVSTGYNLALSRLAKIPGALLCLSDPFSFSGSANDQSHKAHRRGGCCLPTEGPSLSVLPSNKWAKLHLQKIYRSAKLWYTLIKEIWSSSLYLKGNKQKRKKSNSPPLKVSWIFSNMAMFIGERKKMCSA